MATDWNSREFFRAHPQPPCQVWRPWTNKRPRSSRTNTYRDISQILVRFTHLTEDNFFIMRFVLTYKLKKLIQTSVSWVNIVLFKGKVGANFKMCRCPRFFICRFHQYSKAWISIPGFLNQANRTTESNFTACQNSLSEHSFEGVPASLYNLTKSVPGPLHFNRIIASCGYQQTLYIYEMLLPEYHIGTCDLCIYHLMYVWGTYN